MGQVAARSRDDLWRAGQAELLDATCRWDDLQALAADAPQQDHVTRRIAAEAAIRAGRMSDAIALLDPVLESGGVRPPSAIVVRADALRRVGRRSRARTEYEDVIRMYRRDRPGDAETLRWVARAAWGLGAWSDANATFRDALAADPRHHGIRRDWAALFAEKYRPDEALRLLDEVVTERPGDALAWASRARIALAWRYDVDGAIADVDRARRTCESLPEAAEVLAEIALDQRRWHDAREHLESAASLAAGREERIAMLAATAWLADDLASWRRWLDEALERYPTSPTVFLTTAQLGVRSFRYVEVVPLLDEALDMDPDHAPTLLELGLALSRVGREDRATGLLARAFDLDPFNARAMNLATLLETMENDYVLVDEPALDGVRYRFRRTRRSVLEALVGPVTVGAWRRYVRDYQIEPPRPVQIEFLDTPEDFGVRSVGLPRINQHGICFGHLVTSRSPHEGNFNWRQVLEHELSHVFSMHRSRHRVPRWFTEGLAEYDTFRERPEFLRREELALARTLQEGRYIPVEGLDQAFTAGDDMERILAAYFQASLVVRFIGEEQGYDRLMQMLDAWARGATLGQVFVEVVGEPLDAFNRRFEASLREGLGPLLSVLEPSLVRRRSARDETPRREDTEAAVHALRRGAVEDAVAIARAQLADSGTHPTATWVLARVAVERGDVAEAEAQLASLEVQGWESWSLRVLLADALEATDRERALAQIRRATTVYPRGAEAWERRWRWETGDAARAALEQWASLAIHDVEPRLRLAAELLAAGEARQAHAWASRAVDVAPFRVDVQGVAGRAAAAAEAWEDAARALRLELILGAPDAAETRALLDQVEARMSETP